MAVRITIDRSFTILDAALASSWARNLNATK
jgi:hypothetical protein